MAIALSRGDVSAYLHCRFPLVKMHRSGGCWRLPCPIHGGKNPNLSVDENHGGWKCFSGCDGRTGDLFELEMEISKCDFRTAKNNIYNIIGKRDDWMPRSSGEKQLGKLERIYYYENEKGEIVYAMHRHHPAGPGLPKEFRSHRHIGGGRYYAGMNGTTRVPYHLPKLMAAHTAWIVEGEKCVEELDRHLSPGEAATTNSEGGKNFQDEICRWFEGKTVYILPDNDQKGMDHAQDVAEKLFKIASSVRVVEIPDLKEKGDVYDFFAAGGSMETLRSLVQDADPWDPSQKIDPEDRYTSTPREMFEAMGGIAGFWKPSGVKHLATPFRKLTVAMSGGLRRGEVYALGGRSGSGKTSLALQFAIHAAKEGHGVLMFSMEMDRFAVMRRMIGMEARVSIGDFEQALEIGKQDESTFEMGKRLSMESQRAEGWPFRVHERTRITPEYIASECLRMKDKFNSLDLVIVDHMQLMASEEKKKSEYEEFTSISRRMKSVAVEVKVPLLYVSQTSRPPAGARYAELDMGRLRASGALEEDAATVMLIYEDPEDAKLAKSTGRYEDGPVKTILKVDKNRYGRSGVYLQLAHNKSCTRFDLWADDITPSSGPIRKTKRDHYDQSEQ